MKISFKDSKFLLLIVILLVVLVVLAMIEGYLKEEVIDKEEIKAREITPTVQSAMIYNYVRIGNWDKLFNKINDDNKSYDLKDLIEEKIEQVTTYKMWNINEVIYSEDGYLTISIYSELSKDVMQVKYDKDKNEVVSFKLNGELK